MRQPCKSSYGKNQAQAVADWSNCRSIHGNFIFALYAATKPAEVTIFVDGEKVVAKTRGILVREALKENRITVSDKDIVIPSLDSCIADSNGVIRINKAKKAVAFKRGFRETIYFYSSDLKGVKREFGIDNTERVSFVFSGELKSGMIVRAEPVKEISSQYFVYFDERGRIVSKREGAGIKRVR